MLDWYVNLLAKHPYRVVGFVASFSIICCILPFTVKSMRFPSFEDPQNGFLARHTSISGELMAYQNLETELKFSGSLTRNPKAYLSIKHKMNQATEEVIIRRKKEEKKPEPTKTFNNSDNAVKSTKPPKRAKLFSKVKQIEEPDVPNNTSVIYGKVVKIARPDPKKKTMDEKWHILRDYAHHVANNLSLFTYEHAYCGAPERVYAHIVITSVDKENLFTFKHLRSLCKLENMIMNQNSVPKLCISNKPDENSCCRPWSIPNYIAKLYDRTSCLLITEGDVNNTLSLLSDCSYYYHNNDLREDCLGMKDCNTPEKCVRGNAVFHIFNYLASDSFFPKDRQLNYKPKLSETIIFLPLASGVAIVPFFKEINNLDSTFEGLQIVAMNFGIKGIIFDEYLLTDAWFMVLGALFIFAFVWMYTTSIFLTFMALLSLVFGLAITYFLYTEVYRIAFFPFMNVVSVIICLGVGVDNAFIFRKMWNVKQKELEREEGVEVSLRILRETFAHVFKSLCVTSLTTSVAFWGSYVSKITAIRCFSVFAGTAIAVNFLLTISLFPACLVILNQVAWLSKLPNAIRTFWFTWLRSSYWLPVFNETRKNTKAFIIKLVMNLHYFWIFIFISIGLGAIMIVFVFPSLMLPVDAEVQLLRYNHPFEQYDFVYKKKFWFHHKEGDSDTEEYNMPLRFIWGVLPVDNGDRWNPNDSGSLVYDPFFNMTDINSQFWLRDFCSEIKTAPFFHPRLGISLTSCFIETFITTMERSCIDPVAKKSVAPCCNVSSFPFTKSVFDQCILNEMQEIYGGPSDYLFPRAAGAYFSKEDQPEIKAVIVEFDSNVTFSYSFKDVRNFYNEVKKYFRNQLLSAPRSMKNGFFTSDFAYYDIQHQLMEGTFIAVFLSIFLATCVLFFTTLNPLMTVMAILTMILSIFTTIASIILLGWKLNALESTVISISIGLSVDFSLHYCINYEMCIRDRTGDRKESTTYALNCLMGPTFMAAFTTAISGFCMIFSWVLPYHQIGLFLVLNMTISWCYATFFLCSLLVTAGPTEPGCQLSYQGIFSALWENNNEAVELRNIQQIPSVSGHMERDYFIAPIHNPQHFIAPIQNPHPGPSGILRPEVRPLDRTKVRRRESPRQHSDASSGTSGQSDDVSTRRPRRRDDSGSSSSQPENNALIQQGRRVLYTSTSAEQPDICVIPPED